MENEIWYVVDACWDDKGEYTVPSRYSYFLLGKNNTVIKDGIMHIAFKGLFVDPEKINSTDPVLVYPEIGDENYSLSR